MATREAPVDYSAIKHNLDLPRVMSYLLVPHLPRLVAWERRTTVTDRQTYRQTDTQKYIYICGAPEALTCTIIFKKSGVKMAQEDYIQKTHLEPP